VRICTVKDFSLSEKITIEYYQALRQDIIQLCVNHLEQYDHDEFLTEQIFEILRGIVRKCY